DTCSAVKEFFTSEKLLGEFNTTIISLVPKTKSPARVTDYRPISYCNVVYKEISKVITNRIKTILGELVDYNQSAFIPSRQISENILSALEFMKGKLKITSQCFADDMLMLCHGDMVLLSILKRGLDEFSLAFGLYPSMTKSEAFFCGHTPEVKAKTMFAMPFSEVCDTIDKLVKKFLWTKGDNAIGMVSVGWKEVCKTKSQEGLGLRPLHDWK
ncbi:RNA-directed DNA polymerase, eukaryota, reverse transcriptase zinc-binding domain protein, partial [Tanacetum coccineum]